MYCSYSGSTSMSTLSWVPAQSPVSRPVIFVGGCLPRSPHERVFVFLVFFRLLLARWAMLSDCRVEAACRLRNSCLMVLRRFRSFAFTRRQSGPLLQRDLVNRA